MSDKSVSISNLASIIIGSMGFIISSASAYIAILLKNITQKFERVKDNLAVLKENHLDLKKDLGEAFDRIRLLENKLSVIEVEHKINHRVNGNEK